MANIHIDLYHDNKYSDMVYISCFFYPNEKYQYRGNLYNRDRKPIGDYACTDSVMLEQIFNYDFGD